MVPTVVCGAWLLTRWLKDAPTCWAVACGLGVALAALAALWGHGFATGSETETAVADPDTASATASGAWSGAVRGPFRGSISTGDSSVPHTAPGDPRHRSAATAPPRQKPLPGQAPVPGSAMAAGERAVAVNGALQGAVSTGDWLDAEPLP